MSIKTFDLPRPKVVIRVLATGLLILASQGAAAGRDVNLAISGNDTATGERGQPVATLARARDLVRQARKAGMPATVTLQGGTYYLPETLILTREDSGAKDAPVVWQAAEGQTVVISG